MPGATTYGDVDQGGDTANTGEGSILYIEPASYGPVTNVGLLRSA